MTELREEGVDLSEVSLAIFEECQIHSANQVWSLAQFYSVDLSPSEIRVNKCVHNKRTIKVCVSCFWRCPGTSMPSVAHLTVSLSLCRSGSNTWGESRALEGRSGSSKCPSRVRDNGEGVAGRNEREQYFPQRVVIDFPSRQINDFFTKRNQKKIELVATPDGIQPAKWLVHELPGTKLQRHLPEVSKSSTQPTARKPSCLKPQQVAPCLVSLTNLVMIFSHTIRSSRWFQWYPTTCVWVLSSVPLQPFC